MTDANARLLLIGCGKMGGALLARALAAQLASKIYVVDPASPPFDVQNIPVVLWAASQDKIDPTFAPDLVLIAVKPQHIAEVLPHYARFQNAVFVSIAAGTRIEKLQNLLGGNRAVIRVMPNLPASIGKGVSVAVANRQVTVAQRALTDRFLKTVGALAWIEDETLMDAVTALSGSGPAYVFALCEGMAKAGENLGLPADLAAMLARQTIIGSGALLEQSTELAENLRKAVTSPGGTTEAALRELLSAGGLESLIQKAMTSAAKRARELAN